MTPSLIDRLVSFQGELAKGVFCWPKHHGITRNTTATLAVGLVNEEQNIGSETRTRISAKYPVLNVLVVWYLVELMEGSMCLGVELEEIYVV